MPSPQHKRCLFMLVFFALPIGWVANTGTVRAQCDTCLDRSVYLYDARVEAPMPVSDADSLRRWYSLFWPARVARYWSCQGDPDSNCFIWTDAGANSPQEYQANAHQSGDEDLNLPPPDSLSIASYFFTGSVASSGPNLYALTWQIRCGVSREVVRSSTVMFSPDSAVSINTAGKTAAQALMPIETALHTFELEKRESDPGVARGGTGAILRVASRRQNLLAHDTTTVALEMVDCDGYPLKNREIVLQEFSDSTLGDFPGVVGGKVTPTHVTTDGAGRAHVVFEAGDTPTVAVVHAAYLFRKPCGARSALLGHATLNLDKTMWDVTVTHLWTETESIDFANEVDGKRQVEKKNWYTMVQGYLHFIYEDKNPDTTEGGVNLNVTIPSDSLAAAVYASYSQGWSIERGAEKYEVYESSGGLSTGFYTCRDLYGTDYISAKKGDPKYVGLSFTTNSSFKMLQLQVDYHLTGSEHIWSRPGPGKDKGPQRVDMWAPGMYDLVTSMDEGARFVDSAGVHKVTYSDVSTLKGEGSSTTTSAMVLAVFRRGGQAVTGMDRWNPSTLPDRLVLFPNYPNPFNPSTTIGYTVPGTGNRHEAIGNRWVKLAVYDMLGREVAVLVNEKKEPGSYTVTWDANGMASGVYFYRLQTNGIVQTRKMLLMK